MSKCRVRLIGTRQSEGWRLAKSGEDDEPRMKLVALEYRARLVLERFRKPDAN